MTVIHTLGHSRTGMYAARLAPQPERLQAKPKSRARNHRSSHVLIVTDHQRDLGAIAELLCTQLFKVTFASGWPAYYRAQACAPDLILIDGDMQEMDGFMTGRLFKQSPATRAIPVIFLAKQGHGRKNLEAFAFGAVDCITKPFYPEELLARISVHLRLAFSMRRLPAIAGTESATPWDDILLRNALDIIQSDIGSLHVVRDLAQRIGTHERRLSTIFRSKTGMSAHKFIQESKMDIACRLLANTGMPIHHVAEHVGFHSVCNFTVAFRRRQGVTPTTYRQRLQRNAAVTPGSARL